MRGRPWSRAFSAVVGDGSGGARGARAEHARRRAAEVHRNGACREAEAWSVAGRRRRGDDGMGAEQRRGLALPTASSPTATHTLPHGGRSYAPTSPSCSPSSLTTSSTWSTAKQTDDVGLARLVDFADVKRIDDRMHLWTGKLDPLLLQGMYDQALIGQRWARARREHRRARRVHATDVGRGAGDHDRAEEAGRRRRRSRGEEGDEDGNRDGIREEDRNYDWSGMVLILITFSGI